MRFVLRYRRPGSIPEEHLLRIGRLEGVRVLDRSPRMLLVEGDESALQRFVESASGWLLAPEAEQYQIPDPHPKPRKPQ